MMTPYKKVNVTDAPRLKLAINLTRDCLKTKNSGII